MPWSAGFSVESDEEEHREPLTEEELTEVKRAFTLFDDDGEYASSDQAAFIRIHLKCITLKH